MHRLLRQWQHRLLRHSNSEETIALPRPSLFGSHQIDNAAVAVACLRQLSGLAVGPDHFATGLRAARWPARLERLRGGALVAGLGAAWELWLDAGHNAAAGAALAEAATAWRDRPLHLVVGMLNTKDPVGFLKPLADVAREVRCVAIPGEAASLTAADVAAAARAAGLDAATAPSVEAAVEAIGATALAGRILICGSIYLVGKLLPDDHG